MFDEFHAHRRAAVGQRVVDQVADQALHRQVRHRPVQRRDGGFDRVTVLDVATHDVLDAA
ncbi:hypothetical protein CKO37_12610 [Rubrivivax gelatinosus]|nr:hypothetical protein [Rubrivivax gelatinosus]